MSQYPASPESLARIAARAAQAAGDRVHELRRTGVTVAALKSSAVDMVTEADQEAERMIVGSLLAERPDDGVLGEEGANAEGSSGITWIIDPIDGTTNYIYDIPAYVVSIAATVADPEWSNDGFRTIAAAVYNPNTRELFEAWAGGGALRNGEPITTSGTADIAAALVGTGFGYTVERKREQLEMVQRLIPRVRDLRRIGAAAYDLCLVACGRLDAYYERGLNAWDYAAGMLIAKEAGAEVIGRDALTPPGAEMLYAASPGLADPLRAITGDTEE